MCVSRSTLSTSLRPLHGCFGWILLVLLGGCGPDPAPETRTSPAAHPEAVALLIDAQKAHEQGAYGAALVLADSAERSAAPHHHRFLADVAFLRGHVYTDLARPEEVQAAYERTLALVPGYRGAYLNLGNLAFRQNQYQKAIAYYRAEEAAHPDPQSLVYIGRAYSELGDVDSARIAYQEALARSDGALAEAHARLSVLYDEGGDLEEALVHIRQALALAEDNVDYRYYLGALLTRTGQVDEAVPVLTRVLAERPAHQQAHYNLGLALDRRGDRAAGRHHLAVADSLRRLDVGVAEWETRARLQPKNPATWATLAYAYHHLGRNGDAVRAYRIALYLDPAHVDVRFALSNLYLEGGEMDAALAGYEALLARDSSYVGAWVNAGVIHARAGRFGAAQRAWEAALRQDADHVAARTYLARLQSTN